MNYFIKCLYYIYKSNKQLKNKIMNTISTFNLEMFKNGVIAKTAIGQTARYGCISRDRLIVIFQSLGGVETQETYQLDGRKYANTSSPFDLIAMA